MNSKLVDALRVKRQPVAIILTNEKPAQALQFKEGGRGCIAAFLLAASEGRTSVFDRKTFGCPGGGTGLGFGDCYVGFPINRLLSTGGSVELGNGQTWDMHEGERFFESPETASAWAAALPIRDIPTEYVVFKPLHEVTEADQPTLIQLFANGDQLSALITLAGFSRGTIENAIAPWGAACHSILFSYAEAERDMPRGVIGFFDISQRHRVEPGILTFTVPYRMFREMEGNIEKSFLRTDPWLKLQERQ
jgi:uncharacterized protein (DUF169 family)